VVTLAGSGLRIGELLGLDVTDVNFLRRTISVCDRGPGGQPRTNRVESSRRMVPVARS